MKTSFVVLFTLFFMTSRASNGIFLEFKASKKATAEQMNTLKIYSLDGNTINESISIKYPTYPFKTLTLKNDTNFSYHISTKFNSYIKLSDNYLKEYEVAFVDSEKVNGFNCAKVILLTANSTSKVITYIWVSSGIPSYESFLSANVNSINLFSLSKALAKVGLAGIPIRINYSVENSLQYDFVKAEMIKLKKSFFSLDKYSESQGMNAEELKKQNKITEKEYNQVQIEEAKARERARQDSIFQDSKK